MDKQNFISSEEIKKNIITELNIGHLTEEEQTSVVSALSDVLLERATLSVFQTLSEEELLRIDELTESGKEKEAQELVLQLVPQSQEIILQAVREGLTEYKQRLVDSTESEVAEPAQQES